MQGSAMVIDVAGDSVMSIKNTDIHPVHAVQQSASTILVLNQDVTEAGTGESLGTTSCLVANPPPPSPAQFIYDVCPSLTSLSFSGSTIGGVSSITLPIYSSPNFVAVAPSATTAYVTLPTYPPNPLIPATIVPSVGVVNTTSRVVTAILPVGNNPYALAVTPDNTKLYVANRGDSTISGFNNASQSQRVGSPTATSSAPIWLQARSDSEEVYALETDGTLAQLTVTSTTGPDTLTEYSNIGVPGAIKMVYDPNLIRLYIAGGSQVAIIDVSQSAPALETTIPITAVPSSTRNEQSDPCWGTTVTTLNTLDVAALPNGSQAYAGSYYEATVKGVNYICPQVTAINTTSNTAEDATIAIPGFPAYDSFCATVRFRLSMAAGGDSSRAYLASCDGGNVNIIDTSINSYIENQPAPPGTQTGSGSSNLPQNPVFLLAGP